MVATYIIRQPDPGEPNPATPSLHYSLRTPFVEGLALIQNVQEYQLCRDEDIPSNNAGAAIAVAFDLDEARVFISRFDTYLVVPGLCRELPEAFRDFVETSHPFKLSLLALSSVQARVLKAQLKNVSVQACPPVDPEFISTISGTAAKGETDTNQSLDLFDCQVIDSRGYHCHLGVFDTPNQGAVDPEFGPVRIAWNREPLTVSFRNRDRNGALLKGFYSPEEWGVWSMTDTPSIELPYIINGNFVVTLYAYGYGNNAGRDIVVSIGAQEVTLTLGSKPDYHSAVFHLSEPEFQIRFKNLDLEVPENAKDTRTMGLGLIEFQIRKLDEDTQAKEEAGVIRHSRHAPLTGTCYVSLMPKQESLAGWSDLITGFTHAFTDTPDATLILAIPTDWSQDEFADVALRLKRCTPFQCRVLLLHGELSPRDKLTLLQHSTYYVNINYLQDSLTPDLYFSISGKPLITPNHDIIAPHLAKLGALSYDTSRCPEKIEYKNIPAFHQMKHCINWESLQECLLNSYHLADESYRYLRTSLRATRAQRLLLPSGLANFRTLLHSIHSRLLKKSGTSR